MKIITSREMARIDGASETEPGVLMERAGMALAGFIDTYMPGLPVCFICGKGNNGGDGFVAARHLLSSGRQVEVWLMGDKDGLSGLPGVQAGLLDTEIKEIKSTELLKYALKTPKIAVDCVFGTGFRPPLDNFTAGVLEIINKNSKITLSCDIPSGVNGDTGEADERAVVADITVTFEFPKVGHLRGRGSLCTGSLDVSEIGTGLSPDEYTETAELTARQDIEYYFARRPRDTHKKSFGHLLVVGGSPGMSGAVSMTALGALRAGAGFVTCAAGRSITSEIAAAAMSCINLPLEDYSGGFIKRKEAGRILEYIKKRKVDALVIGPGLSVEPDSAAVTAELLSKADCPLVLDADGLNNAAGFIELMRKRKAPLLLTPHPGEFSRLAEASGCNSAGADRERAALELSKNLSAALLLKGYRSLAVSAGKVYINPTGGPGMAAAGSGDVLAGICGALMAQGVDPGKAARTAAWVHGRSGDISVWSTGERYLLPEDIINNLWKV